VPLPSTAFDPSSPVPSIDEVVVGLFSAKFPEGVPVTVTDNVLVVLDPQALFALTEIVPPTVPAVVFMEVVVEVPDHPEGNVHV
jgi:hypothetical protein